LVDAIRLDPASLQMDASVDDIWGLDLEIGIFAFRIAGDQPEDPNLEKP
jgi:hypothetical protein